MVRKPLQSAGARAEFEAEGLDGKLPYGDALVLRHVADAVASAHNGIDPGIEIALVCEGGIEVVAPAVTSLRKPLARSYNAFCQSDMKAASGVGVFATLPYAGPVVFENW